MSSPNATTRRRSLGKPISLILLSAFAVYLVFKFSNLAIAPSRVMDVSQAKVIMYSTTRCPYCAKARRYFAKNKIPYFEYNIDQSEQGRRQFISLSGFATPLLIIGHYRMNGFNKKKLDELLLR